MPKRSHQDPQSNDLERPTKKRMSTTTAARHDSKGIKKQKKPKDFESVTKSPKSTDHEPSEEPSGSFDNSFDPSGTVALDANPSVTPNATNAITLNTEKTLDGSNKRKKNRFIVFVGNLPFSATSESIAEHFSKIHPDSIRLITERPSKAKTKGKNSMALPKSKGFAFLEFSGYDRMKTCLKLYHHTDFDDGKSAARKINVELTAGGGGKSLARTEKLKVKNAKLDDERKQSASARKTERTDGNVSTTVVDAATNDIHPSRRGRVQT